MKKMLLKSFVVTILFLVTFFSIVKNSNAANFSYSSFDWDTFAKKNNSFWISMCDTSPDENCVDRVLATTERYYTRLYKLLSEVEKSYGWIDDSIIIATSFYGLDSGSFNDPDPDREDNPYKLDDSEDSLTKDKYIGSVEDDVKGAYDYFSKEEDSLKTLINSFIGYKATCYGKTDPTTSKDKQGNTYQSCPTADSKIVDGKCIVPVESYESTFFDRIGLFTFLKTENDKKCESSVSEKGYTDYEVESSKKEEIHEDFFWNFLENSTYLDNKDHLQEYYIYILGSVKKSKMSELTPDEYEEYKDEIIEVRKRIIRGIKEVLEYYEGMSDQYKEVKQEEAYWWPIGSIETTESNSKIMAVGEPESINITSNYGMRNLDGEEKMHNGIDIGGTESTTNVIASRNGTVVSIVDDNGGACVNGDETCGGSYGNYIIIQHVDGNYTLYAHLAEGSITVKNGDTVSQGQVIGKLGNTGRTTGPHLHFEVRVGGNDSSSAQDPLNYVDPENPRKRGSIGDLEEWLVILESGGNVEDYMQDGKYRIFDAEGLRKYRSVINGVVIEFNKDRMRKYGLNPDQYNYGDLIEKEAMDKVMIDVVTSHMDSIKTLMSQNGYNFNENQMYALVALKYNAGNLEGFVNAYNTYGTTQALCDNWWVKKSSSSAPGLPARRSVECKAFVEGVFENPYG